jgi:hypothetical protein
MSHLSLLTICTPIGSSKTKRASAIGKEFACVDRVHTVDVVRPCDGISVPDTGGLQRACRDCVDQAFDAETHPSTLEMK